ncbi:MAG: hypothetical protein KJI69_01315 [Patescibacteria group bacterium]|nr:hypothetical protein [Patescibacteria group bacterium]
MAKKKLDIKIKTNQALSRIFNEMADLLEINSDGIPFKPRAYRKAANSLQALNLDVTDIYKKQGIKGLLNITGIGKAISEKIEEYIKRKKIKSYEELREKTEIRNIITHFFKTKGLGLRELKQSAKQKKIIYSRYTRPAKDLIELAGSTEKAKTAIDTVSAWALSRDLDYGIETVFKRWLELDRLKPKKIEKKAFYDGKPMIFSKTKNKWFVIADNGEWLEFAGDEKEIEYKMVK